LTRPGGAGISPCRASVRAGHQSVPAAAVGSAASAPASASASASDGAAAQRARSLAHSSDLLDAMDGIRFLPVEQRLYLRAQYVVNLVEIAHPSVLGTRQLVVVSSSSTSY